MLVSIITPSYNSSEFINATYQSIRNQTHQEWEWLVTDDGSTDDTMNLLEEISNRDSRVKVTQNSQNSGAAVSRNSSIARAKGKYLAFLDSDDLWMPEKLEKHLAFMEKKNATLSFTPYELIDEQGKSLNTLVDANLKGSFSHQDMLKKKATMGCCTVIVDKSHFEDVSMPLIRAGQDYALWLKLLKQSSVATIFPEVLSQYRIVSNSLSRNKYKKALKIWEVYRHIEGLNFVNASFVFSHYAIRAFFKLNESEKI
ncbi:glycosyltransferase family 2 protein [Thalassotalea euphylliae]|uniref:glycosyltransferase family 2 protein n=1 Tax=Thalassotalea euphylliae TaxID=1655234 RepID=UPI00362EEB6B